MNQTIRITIINIYHIKLTGQKKPTSVRNVCKLRKNFLPELARV